MALAAVNERLTAVGLSIAREDALMLVELRDDFLAEAERVEFGPPAVVAITEAIASSPFLTEDNVVSALAQLQDAFYDLRDELPVDVPDVEIVEALRGCFDAYEGDTAEVAALSKEEVMAFSEEYRLAEEVKDLGAYRIVDDEGRAYEFGSAEREGRACGFDSAEWGYDERSAGWDGERWSDDWGD